MIKRRFYRLEHGGRDAPSESSSSSDSEVEADISNSEEVEEDEAEEEESNVSVDMLKGEASSSSGYESENSSANEVNLDSSEVIFAGVPTSDDDIAAQNGKQDMLGILSHGERDSIVATTTDDLEKVDNPVDVNDCILKYKSVFKCRWCPRIVCLSEETLKAHLNSKRHARSEKLLREGRLKLMLNEDGQLEGEKSEDHSTRIFSGQKVAKASKKGKGRGKGKKRPRQEPRMKKSKPSTEKPRKERKANR